MSFEFESRKRRTLTPKGDGDEFTTNDIKIPDANAELENIEKALNKLKELTTPKKRGCGCGW